MLTLEFKCFPSEKQKEKIEKWLQISKSVWNCGLSALEAFESNYYYYKATSGSIGKESGGYAPCCQVPWKYWTHFVDGEQGKGAIVPKDKGKSTIQVPYSRIYSDKSHWYIRELKRVKVPQPAERKESWGWQNSEHSLVTGYSCPLSIDFSEPLISRPGLQQSGGLGQVIKGENLAAHREFMAEMPYKFRSGALAGLDTSWQEYTKSRAGVQNGAKKGRPRFKRKRDKIATIVHNNPKGVIVPKGAFLTGIPKLGELKLKGLDRRWKNPDGSIPEIATFKICQYASGYYVQLTGDLIRGRRAKQTTKSMGIDPGLDSFIRLSNGKQYGNPRYYRNAQVKLAELQQELAHKMAHRLILWLNHPDRRHKDIKAIINCSPDKAKKLCEIKTEAEGVALIGGMYWQKLKWDCQPLSNEQKKIQIKIGKLHEKIKRQRKGFNQKLSSEIVTNYQFISCENGLQSQNLRAQAKPQEDTEKGGYKKNRKVQKTGLAKSLSDAGHGDFIAQVEQKSARDGRIFLRNPAAYTSQTCPVCLNKMAAMSNPKLKLYECDCGWKCHRDINAAVNDELALFASLAFGKEFELTKAKNKKWGELSVEVLQKDAPIKLSKWAKFARDNRIQLLLKSGSGRKVK